MPMLKYKQDYGRDPISVRDTDKYKSEYIKGFVEKWDELINWEARAESEGRFFIDELKKAGKEAHSGRSGRDRLSFGPSVR